MKKGFMALLCAVLLSVSAFADFIWDPLTFGYNNISMKGNAKVGYDANKYPTMVVFKEKGKMSMNNFEFMPLVAGFGYLPKKAGFYFMWENFLGIGKFSFKSEKFDKLFFDDEPRHAIALDYSTNLIFGFAFSPVDNLHLSFGAGLAAGVFACGSEYDNTNLGPLTVRRDKFSAGFSVGVPFDVTGRYYFSKHTGILFGLQDTIMLTDNVTGSRLSESRGNYYESSLIDKDLSNYLVRLKLDTIFANKFTFKFGLTTRW